MALYCAFEYSKPAALNGPQFISRSVLREPLQVNDGTIELPKGYGLGIEVDEDRVRELTVKL